MRLFTKKMEQENVASKRIDLWLKHKGLNANSAAQILGYTNASKMYKLLQGTNPGFDTIVELLQTWPDLSPNWLLLGEGPMERQVEGQDNLIRQHGAVSLPGMNTQILTVTLGQDGKQNTELVPVHAQAGYTRQYNEAVFLEQLRPYRVPSFEQGTYRAFEVSGDSMEPTINHADIVVASFVDNWRLLEPNAVYVVVTFESVMLKRIPHRITDPSKEVMLMSDNPDVKPYSLDVSDIQQLWRVQGYISRYIPSKPDITAERLWEVIELLGHDRGEVKRYLMESTPNSAPTLQ